MARRNPGGQQPARARGGETRLHHHHLSFDTLNGPLERRFCHVDGVVCH